MCKCVGCSHVCGHNLCGYLCVHTHICDHICLCGMHRDFRAAAPAAPRTPSCPRGGAPVCRGRPWTHRKGLVSSVSLPLKRPWENRWSSKLHFRAGLGWARAADHLLPDPSRLMSLLVGTLRHGGSEMLTAPIPALGVLEVSAAVKPSFALVTRSPSRNPGGTSGPGNMWLRSALTLPGPRELDTPPAPGQEPHPAPPCWPGASPPSQARAGPTAGSGPSLPRLPLSRERGAV